MLRLPALLLSLSGVPAFEIVELPRTEGFQTHVFDLNEEGLSVGYMLDDELRWRALQWDGNGAVTELGAPGEWSIARGISEIGIAAGISGPTVGDTEPHVWFAGNEARLPVPADAIGASLLDINDDLVSVGSATVQLGNAATAWVLLTPVTLASPSSSAVEITNAPAAVGSVTVEGFPRAAHWGAGGLTLLPDFGGSSSAAGISPSGLVAGGAFHPGDAKFHAVRWDVAGTTLTDLGLFQDLNPTTANDVNDAGTVVGNYTVVPVSGETRALMWTATGAAVELQDALPAGADWILHDARAINGSGWIVGVGERPAKGGGQRAFLMKPL